jgi:hypothetical protein
MIKYATEMGTEQQKEKYKSVKTYYRPEKDLQLEALGFLT